MIYVTDYNLLHFIVELFLTRQRVLLAPFQKCGALGGEVQGSLDFYVEYLGHRAHCVIWYKGVT